MIVFNSENVSDAFDKGIRHLLRFGLQQPSRNGPVLVADAPVTTVYYRPWERVVFHPARDYNIFFNIYESFWMLAGRNDVLPLKRYVSNFDRYSDDGATLHGAYGFRWRHHFGFDQLARIAGMLAKNPNDRRAVLQMWDARVDLGADSKDVPCNDMVTFQVGPLGSLNMVVFCRSNDALWGTYFANAFHFSMLHEYMSVLTGYPQGTYTQVSVNFHVYVEALTPDFLKVYNAVQSESYRDVNVQPMRLQFTMIDAENMLRWADNGCNGDFVTWSFTLNEAAHLLKLHALYRAHGLQHPLIQEMINMPSRVPMTDWSRSAQRWFQRRAREKKA